MRCEQCGRALTPAAATTVICPSCGFAAIVPAATIESAHLANDDSATRPVPPAAIAPVLVADPAPLLEQDRPTIPPPPPEADTLTASPLGAYVPPAVPRARAEGLAEPIPSGGDDAREQAPPIPSALLRGQDPVHDTRPVNGPAVQAALTQRGKRRGLGVLSVVALVVVLALGTAGALLAANGRLNDLFAPMLPAPTATPIVTFGPADVPTGFTRFVAPDGTYSLAVPAAWAHVTSGQLTLFTDGHAGINFEIDSLAGQLDPQTVAQDYLSRLGPLIAGSAGTAEVGSPTRDSVPVAGLAWARTAADISVTSSGATVSWHTVVLVTQHSGQTLLVAYYAPSSLFASEDATHFQTMLSTLMLLAPQP